MIQVMVSKSPTRKNIANTNPMVLALFGWDGSSLSEIMEIKIILSTPNTISKKVSVSRLIHTEGSEKSGKVIRVVYIIRQI